MKNKLTMPNSIDVLRGLRGSYIPRIKLITAQILRYHIEKGVFYGQKDSTKTQFTRCSFENRMQIAYYH